MSELQFRGLVGVGNATFDVGISDLLVLETAGGPVLVSVSGHAGGLVSYGLADGRLPAALTWRGTLADTTTATGPGLTVQDGGLLVAGLDHAAVSAVALSGSGVLSWPQEVSAGFDDWSVIASVGSDMLALADASGDGFALYRWTPGGNLMLLESVADSVSAHAENVSVMTATSQAGRDFIILGSASEQGISVYQVHNGQTYLRGSVGPAEGLGLMTPTALEVVTCGGQAYVIVASAPVNDGASGALSVMALGETGQLLPTDHVIDSRDSRFGQVQDMAVTSYNGIPLIAVGGGDDGVTLLALTPSGQLVHLDSFADTTETGLTGITGLEMVVIGDEVQVFASSGADAGLTVLTADLSRLGQALEADAGGGTLTGTNGDDILVEGAGFDVLYGGTGSDIFVLGVDGITDRIMDFDPARDVLDLSSYPLLHDVSEVMVIPTATGALLSARGENLLLVSANGQPLTPEQVRAAIDLSLDRVFLPPEIDETGSAAADSLLGSWGTDRLSGGAGNDTLCGGLGDDTLDGGSGIDQAEFDLRRNDIAGVWVEGDSVTLLSGEGEDIITGVEWFAFDDGTLSLAQMAAMVTSETITGSTGDDLLTVTRGTAHLIGRGGDDTLIAAGGHDTLWGGDGNDDLSGGSGNDTLTGGAGNDVLRGGAGTDWALFDSTPSQVAVRAISGDRATIESADGIDVIDGIEFVRFGNSVMSFAALSDLLAPTLVTGTSGNDLLSETGDRVVIRGFGGADTLTSGAGDDTLEGGDGNDVLNAAAGSDWLYGGTGNDLLLGGDGNDSLHGGAGNDVLRGGDGTDRVLITGHSSQAVTIAISGNRATIESSEGRDVIEDVEWVQFDDRLLRFDQLDALIAPDITRLYGDAGNNTLSHVTSEVELFGGDGNDSLRAGDFDDLLDGGGGQDTLIAGAGHDTLRGGAGNDSLNGGRQNDRLDGDDGNDMLIGDGGRDTIDGGNGDDTLLGGLHMDDLYGGSGRDSLDGGGGDDTLNGGGDKDTVRGGNGDDILEGRAHRDTLRGGGGQDTLLGGGSADRLFGGGGRDSLDGGVHDDRLVGGRHDDTLTGGGGADTFVFDRGHDADVITDFDAGEDILLIKERHADGLDAAGIADLAVVTGLGVVIDFGGGDTVLLDGVYSLSGLEAAIEII